MLVLSDCGLQGYDMAAAIQARGADLLGRLSSSLRPTVLRRLTSLTYPAIAPDRELIVAYHTRREFELCVDELVTHLNLRVPLRSQTPPDVLQEIYSLFLAHYVVRAAMHVAALPTSLPPTRFSFLDSLRLFRETLPRLLAASPRPRYRVKRPDHPTPCPPPPFRDTILLR